MEYWLLANPSDEWGITAYGTYQMVQVLQMGKKGIEYDLETC